MLFSHRYKNNGFLASLIACQVTAFLTIQVNY
jgi:hypothetical protein